MIGKKLRLGRGNLVAVLLRLGHPLDSFEAVFRIGGRTAAAKRRRRRHALG